MNIKAQIMISAIFALFFVVAMNIVASERDKRIILGDYCQEDTSLCISHGW